MRIRALKPEFFKNVELCDLSTYHRLCFAGLWCCADRDGRMRDRPKRLKADIFPYDDLNVDLLLWDLTRAGFIRRYVIGSQPLIDIPTWARHQHPRGDEAASELPPYVAGTDRSNGVFDVSTYPAARTIETDPAASVVVAPDTSIVTDPSLVRDEHATTKRMGSGKWEVGNGTSGNGNSAADAASSPEATRKTRDEFRAQDLIDLWNATTKPPIPRCRELTENRRRKIRLRMAERPSLAEWREAFEALQANAFCRGENDRGWVADFDWVIKNDTVAAKLLERARSRQEVNRSYEFVCPHEPKCSGRNDCYLKQQLERAKAV